MKTEQDSGLQLPLAFLPQNTISFLYSQNVCVRKTQRYGIISLQSECLCQEDTGTVTRPKPVPGPTEQREASFPWIKNANALGPEPTEPFKETQPASAELVLAILHVYVLCTAQ